MTVEWQPRPERGLRHPILVVAFEGWFDVARSATGAVQWLVDQFDAQPLAAIDPEPYFDFTARRPMVKMQDGERVIVWPENACLAALTAGDPDTAGENPGTERAGAEDVAGAAGAA